MVFQDVCLFVGLAMRVTHTRALFYLFLLDHSGSSGASVSATSGASGASLGTTATAEHQELGDVGASAHGGYTQEAHKDTKLVWTRHPSSFHLNQAQVASSRVPKPVA